MGTDPTTDIWTPGDDCNNCKNTIFFGNTPRYVEVLVEGMVKCPFAILDPPNGVHLLTQNNVRPCIWDTAIGAMGISWKIELNDSVFQIEIGHILFWFLSSTPDNCVTSFTNEVPECGGDWQAIGGTAKIFFGPTIGP